MSVANHQSYITGISAKYNDIADWLIANPHKGNKGECAIVHRISQSWLSTIIHTDAFKALMAMKQQAVFEEVVIPTKAKLMGLAESAVERLGEVLDETKDERLVHDITKTSLTLLGYGASKAQEINVVNNTQNNTMVVDSAALAVARDRRTEHYTKEKALENSSSANASLPATILSEGISSGGEPGVGEGREVRAKLIHRASEVHGTEEEGSGV